MRKLQYEKILDDIVFIARASEGSISVDWLMEQPVFVREKYVKSFQDELEKRKKELDARSNNTPKK